MGVYTFTGICAFCGKMFSFHPNKVPSLHGQPICKNCVDNGINPILKAKGQQVIVYAEDAYKPALDEEEDRIDWGD